MLTVEAMNTNMLRGWLRGPLAGFRCVLGTTLEIIVFRVNSSFIVHLYGRPAERRETVRLIGTVAALGFAPSELITCFGPGGVASDYAQAVLNASSLKAAKAKLASFLLVAAKGKPIKLSPVRRSPAFRLVVSV
jgi:hypothetical protein